MPNCSGLLMGESTTDPSQSSDIGSYSPNALSYEDSTSTQLLNAATSASQASPDEWVDLVGWQNVRPNDTISTVPHLPRFPPT
jgi:hypothetical protein